MSICANIDQYGSPVSLSYEESRLMKMKQFLSFP